MFVFWHFHHFSSFVFKDKQTSLRHQIHIWIFSQKILTLITAAKINEHFHSKVFAYKERIFNIFS